MKRILLAGASLAFMSMTAHASPCAVVQTIGNIQFLQGSSDAQCNDGDDLKLFLDGVTNANSAGGSLGGNNNSPADSNITITSNGTGFGASTDANGFANFKSVADNVSLYQMTPNVGTILPKSGDTFMGFDGSLFRGQLTDNVNTPGVTWDGDVTIFINLSDGSTVERTYTGFSMNTDIGTIGFDEINEGTGVFVTSYFAVAGDVSSGGVVNPAGLGSWDEFKQIEMSVPGQIASIPEPKTWVMLLTGFGLISLAASRRRSRVAAV